MRTTLLLALTALPATVLRADVPLQRLGRPFGKTEATIAWASPTNKLPSHLWTYRALPSEFPQEVVSNLLVIGHFTRADRKAIPNDPSILFYEAADGKRNLRIVSKWSDIRYRDSNADDMSIAEGVPSEERASFLATDLLPQLRIDPAQLAKSADGLGLRRYPTFAKAILSKDFSERPYATNIHLRGITFMRALDGVEFFGGSVRGGCSVEFGHHEKIAQIWVSWRKFKRESLYRVASPETFLKWIHEAQAV